MSGLILSSPGPGGQILTGGTMMEGGQLGGMSLNVLPVSESENILTQEQMEADNAAVQSMEVSLDEGFIFRVIQSLSCLA